MSRIFVSLGSNLGNKKDNLEKSLEKISLIASIKNASSLYQTKPWGYLKQDYFYNAVAEIASDLAAHSLLEELKDIEHNLGRKETKRWGPRIIDLDILLYGDAVIKDDNLKVPHPELKNRVFQLLPLLELDSGLKDPRDGLALKHCLEGLQLDPETIKKIAFFQKDNLCWHENI
ncbi:MAG: 2-amino-4-hydroxy-6-hydroxymethyldihydropteridine diphosphokinase [Candidatus Omnitrophica bacterium]|nr:2-amino-4-hydroxy-6-hydroxymethyldihydropteridine diphosphokinase [Candidatus Omnitrophota bacterium]